MQAIDFTRAKIAWTTHDRSRGLWRVASAARCETGAAWYLAFGVMAGDVYGQGRLPLQPAYSFQFAASCERHVMFREPHEAANVEDTDADNASVFRDLTIEAPEIAADVVALGSTDVRLGWPLTARLSTVGRSGARLDAGVPRQPHQPARPAGDLAGRNRTDRRAQRSDRHRRCRKDRRRPTRLRLFQSRRPGRSAGLRADRRGPPRLRARGAAGGRRDRVARLRGRGDPPKPGAGVQGEFFFISMGLFHEWARRANGLG